MKVQITVKVDEKDGEFFADLLSGKYDWASSAQLMLSGAGENHLADALWLLRADVAVLPET